MTARASTGTGTLARKPKKQGKTGEERWITINGAHVLVDGDGNLKGKAGKKIQATTRVASLSSAASSMKAQRSKESKVVLTEKAREDWKARAKEKQQKRVKRHKEYAQIEKMRKQGAYEEAEELERIHFKNREPAQRERQSLRKEYDRIHQELFNKHVEEGLPKMTPEEKGEYAWREREKKRLGRLGYEYWDFPARDLVYQTEFRRIVQYRRADIREQAKLEKEQQAPKPRRSRKKRNSGG